MDNFVHVFEVGPRDGLQNEKERVPLKWKLEMISGLIHAGVRDLEVGAFVRPDRVPQMADTDQIYEAISTKKLNLKSATIWSLVPNQMGLARALRSQAKNVAVFTAATETFAKKNIGMSISDSIREFNQMIQMGRRLTRNSLKVRGYVSTAFGCPFEGKVSAKKALRVIEKLAELDVEQVSIGDTIGVASPKQVTELIKPALRMLSAKKVAVHFHDTRGTALANALRALDLGVRIIDSSTGGLGGCPFAPGAAGNLPTEDLIYMLHGMGMKTGIDLEKMSQVSMKISKRMKRPILSRFLQTL
jgi:hydroxymethylglutaryl-CoA lyase